jgi:hypothetical protein
MNPVDTLVRTLLYEGYVLWPYRRSALKNRQRWSFGGVYPRAYSDASGGTDRWFVQAQVPFTGGHPVIDVELRFLQVLDRLPAIDDGRSLRFVDEIAAGGRHHLAWDEAMERRVSIHGVVAGQGSRAQALLIPAGEEREGVGPLDDPATGASGVLVRRWHQLSARLSVEMERVADGVGRLTVRLENCDDAVDVERGSAVRRALMTANLILKIGDGEFVSLLEPAAGLEDVAASCRNEGLFPVLVGPEGRSDTVLASPIILYDHPRIAPESPGDLYDATEIDQMLVLNLLALTDDEKAEIRATDPATRAILDRTESLSETSLRSLNGAIRDFRPLPPDGRWDSQAGDAAADAQPATIGPDGLLAELDRPGPMELEVAGGRLRPGSRVVLRPHPGGDTFDVVLRNRVGIVESIETDFEGRLHVAVTIEDDPGRDLGELRMPGHRFFLAPDELELLGEPAGVFR